MKIKSTNELAEILGVHRTTINRWILHKNLPTTIVDFRYTFKKSDVKKWLKNNAKYSHLLDKLR